MALVYRLTKTFGQQTIVVAEPAPRSTVGFEKDRFEVDLDGVLLHSKMSRSEYGDECCESEEEIAYLVARICEALGLDGSEPIR